MFELVADIRITGGTTENLLTILPAKGPSGTRIGRCKQFVDSFRCYPITRSLNLVGAILGNDLTIEMERGSEPIDWDAFDVQLHKWKTRKSKFQKVLVKALDWQHRNVIKIVE